MAKQRRTAIEIRDEINRRMSTTYRLNADCKTCRVALPRQARPEDYGGNWHVDSARNCPSACIGLLDRTVGDVRRLYDCSDW